MSDTDAKASKKTAVILVHGIRDFAFWQTTLRQCLEEHGYAVRDIGYGRMNLFKFLLPFQFFRQRAVRQVWEQIKRIQDDPRLEGFSISVIAHSFGTYIVAELLRDQVRAKFEKVIFCGSVVSETFPVSKILDSVKYPILNEVATADPWPAFAESVSTGYGSIGTFGFRDPDINNRFHNDATHSYYLSAQFCRHYWIPFLDRNVICQGDFPKKPPLWIRMLKIFKIKYLICTIVIAFIGYLLYEWFTVRVVPPKPPCPLTMQYDERQKCFRARNV